MKVLGLVKKSVALAYAKKISGANLEKAATIYESTINQKEDEEEENLQPDEEIFSKQFHFFIIGYFDLIRVVYGRDYLELFSDEEDSGEDLHIREENNSKNFRPL